MSTVKGSSKSDRSPGRRTGLDGRSRRFAGSTSGHSQMEVLEAFGKMFGLHPLLEDIATDQRPKLDDYGTYGYVVLKMLYEGRTKATSTSSR